MYRQISTFARIATTLRKQFCSLRSERWYGLHSQRILIIALFIGSVPQSWVSVILHTSALNCDLNFIEDNPVYFMPKGKNARCPELYTYTLACDGVTDRAVHE